MDEQSRWLTSSMTNAAMWHTVDTKVPSLRQILLDFLEVLDSLDRMVTLSASAEQQSEVKEPSWQDHLRALQRQFLAALEAAGVTFFDSVGQPFDPGRHAAVETVRRRDLEDGVVMEELARGCEWHGEVLRFAQVVVVRNPNRGRSQEV